MTEPARYDSAGVLIHPPCGNGHDTAVESCYAAAYRHREPLAICADVVRWPITDAFSVCNLPPAHDGFHEDDEGCTW